MPGMGRSLQSGNSVIVSAFHTALLHQLFVVLILGALCAIGFNVVRTIQYRRLKEQGQSTFPSRRTFSGPEPAARRILRIGFGGLWILDGLLQLQSAMPLGLPTSVIEPSASTSPGWVQHLVNDGVSIWSNHPDPGRLVSRLDPARARPLAPRRSEGPLVAAGRRGQRRLGAGGVGLR